MVLFLSGMGLPSSALAQYTIPWSTIDGGGGQSDSASYCVTGTIGQSDVGYMRSSITYQLSGGFWAGGIFCFVDMPDLKSFLSQWLLKESEVGYELDADLNDDGEVNLKDYYVLAIHWLEPCPMDWPSW